MLKTQIEDGENTGRRAKVTEFGQLVVAPVAYSTTQFREMALDNTAYNFAAPQNGDRIVITDIIIYANKNVGTGDATVVVYENSIGPDDTTEDKVLFETEMLKQTNVILNGLNLITTKGVWVNGKTNDNTVFMTVMYYYV